jgi:hypothetical protein
MATINIQLPLIDADQTIEIEVRVNGKRKTYHYRVEILKWEECMNPSNKAQCLREQISNYDQQWQLVQIGSAGETDIPVMFKQMTN